MLLVLRQPTSCSGPTLDGTAAAILEGDHLDVVGHFDSEKPSGTMVFKAGANFDDDLTATDRAPRLAPRVPGPRTVMRAAGG